MFFLVQVDRYNLPRYLLLLLLALAPFGYGGSSRLPTMIIELLITAAFLVFWLANWSRQPRINASRFDVFLFLFLVMLFISFTLAPCKHDALRCLLLILGCLATYYLLLFNFSRSTIRGPAIVLILSACLQGGIGLFQYKLLGMERVAGTFLNANFYAGFLVAILPLSLGEFLFHRKNPLWYVVNAVILTGILLSGSRGAALVLLIISLFLLCFFRKKKIIIGFLLLVTALAALPNPLRDRVLTAGKNDIYAYTRISIWKSALAIIRDHWKTGVGLGQYRYISTAYSFPVERAWARYARVAEYAHNEYLQLGAEMGLLSLFLVLAAIAWFFSDAAAQIRIQRFLSPENKRNQVLLLAGIMAILLHALVDFGLHVPANALLLTALAALFRTLDERPPEKSLCFINRQVYRVPIALILLGYAIASIRPFLGYYFFQKVDLNRQVTENIFFLKKALLVDSLCASYHNSLGGAYFAKYGESRNIIWLFKGIHQAEIAASLNPNDYQFPRSLGDGYYNLYWSVFKDPSYLRYAREELLKAIELAPYDYRLHSRLSSVEYLDGKFDKALQYMAEAVRLEPNYLRGHYQLALIRKKLGDTAGASREYEKIREIRKQHLEDKVTSEYEAELIDFDYSCLDIDSPAKEAI
ncbi:MAG: O-antigen ligase family protein [bacterium]